MKCVLSITTAGFVHNFITYIFSVYKRKWNTVLCNFGDVNPDERRRILLIYKVINEASFFLPQGNGPCLEYDGIKLNCV